MTGERMLDVFLNYRCQAKCGFCYNPPLTAELEAWELPLPRLAAELTRAAREGFGGVTFSGGEVTLRRDLATLLALSRRAGLERRGIISNGIRLAEAAYAAGLAEAGLNFCCLSVHGARAGSHDRIVKVPGAFDKILRALGHLRERGIVVVLNYVLVRDNLSEIGAFLERFGPLPGVAEFQVYYPHYDGLMELHADALAVPMPEAVSAMRAALAAAERAGADGRVRFYNIPPCAAPDLLPRLRNWEDEEEGLLVDPEGLRERALRPERRERVKIAECARCALNGRCLGYEGGYVRRFGTRGLRALAGAECP